MENNSEIPKLPQSIQDAIKAYYNPVNRMYGFSVNELNQLIKSILELQK